jgi:hypothetical protein
MECLLLLLIVAFGVWGWKKLAEPPPPPDNSPFITWEKLK